MLDRRWTPGSECSWLEDAQEPIALPPSFLDLSSSRAIFSLNSMIFSATQFAQKMLGTTPWKGYFSVHDRNWFLLLSILVSEEGTVFSDLKLGREARLVVGARP